MLPLILALALALPSAAYAQTPEPSPSPREAIINQQMHGYLDALIDLQLKLMQIRADAAKREAEWAEYSKPLWTVGSGHANAR
jgi:hypothetical protein